MNNLNSLIVKHYHNSKDIILSCHQALKEQYPELIVRWARIYGHRWAFIHGQATDNISRATIKIQLSSEYGLCIDNAKIITPAELDKIQGILKEYFSNEKYFEK